MEDSESTVSNSSNSSNTSSSISDDNNQGVTTNNTGSGTTFYPSPSSGIDLGIDTSLSGSGTTPTPSPSSGIDLGADTSLSGSGTTPAPSPSPSYTFGTETESSSRSNLPRSESWNSRFLLGIETDSATSSRYSLGLNESLGISSESESTSSRFSLGIEAKHLSSGKPESSTSRNLLSPFPSTPEKSLNNISDTLNKINQNLSALSKFLFGSIGKLGYQKLSGSYIAPNLKSIKELEDFLHDFDNKKLSPKNIEMIANAINSLGEQSIKTPRQNDAKSLNTNQASNTEQDKKIQDLDLQKTLKILGESFHDIKKGEEVTKVIKDILSHTEVQTEIKKQLTSGIDKGIKYITDKIPLEYSAKEFVNNLTIEYKADEKGKDWFILKYSEKF